MHGYPEMCCGHLSKVAAMLSAAVISGTLTGVSLGAPVPGSAKTAGSCPSMSPSLVKQGSEIFDGGGNCFSCHGSDGVGSSLAPDLLRDHKWIHIDGSYAQIVNLVNTGVPQPKEFPAPMPPKGGAALSDTQVCAVAAYVYSLSHAQSASK